MRKTTNRYLARKQRNGGADAYGTWREGRLVTPERIAGHTVTAQLPSYSRKGI